MADRTERKQTAERAHNVEYELHIFEALDATPETTQADLAATVGVAVGTVNWYLKRWAAKGYITIKRIDRWRWRYLLTPQGMARKAVLAREYVRASMALYRRTRCDAQRLLKQVQAAGFDAIIIDGDGEIAEICWLTCLELGVDALQLDNEMNKEMAQRAAANDAATTQHVPRLLIDGVTLLLVEPSADTDADTDADTETTHNSMHADEAA